MSKMPVAWHKQNLHNFKQSLLARKDAAAREEIIIASMEREAVLREMQIEEAERRGMDSFDSDRLLKKKSV